MTTWRNKFLELSFQIPERPNTKSIDNYNYVLNTQSNLIYKYVETSNLLLSNEPKIIVKKPATEYQKKHFNEKYTFCYQSILTGRLSKFIPLTEREENNITDTDKINGGIFPDVLNLTDNLSIIYDYYSSIRHRLYKKRIELYNEYQKLFAEVNSEWWDLYNEYLKSDEWDVIKLNVKERDGNKCVNCGSTINIHVHHFHYDNVGAEDMEDLITVCYECHKSIHYYKQF